jgi:hypothetical protein
MKTMFDQADAETASWRSFRQKRRRNACKMEEFREQEGKRDEDDAEMEASARRNVCRFSLAKFF